MAFDYMHPPEDFEYLGEWCKAWRDPATGDWTISQLLDGLDTEQIILSGEEVRELARLAAQHDPTDYELEYGELRRPMFASPDENGTAVNAAEGAGGEQARIHSVEACAALIKAVSKILRYDTEKERLDGLADATEDVRRWVMLLETENGITDEELGEWVERKTVRQQRRIEDDK